MQQLPRLKTTRKRRAPGATVDGAGEAQGHRFGATLLPSSSAAGAASNCAGGGSQSSQAEARGAGAGALGQTLEGRQRDRGVWGRGSGSGRGHGRGPARGRGKRIRLGETRKRDGNTVYVGRDGKTYVNAEATRQRREDQETGVGAAGSRRHRRSQRALTAAAAAAAAAVAAADDPQDIVHWVPNEEVAETYREEGGIRRLHEWQVQCLRMGTVFHWSAGDVGENLVYSAPTSGGKTLVAELLLLRALTQRQGTALYVVPFISLVEEKAEHLRRMWASLQYGICAFHSNATVVDLEGVRVAVCTIEKANTLVNDLMLTHGLSRLVAAVVDEAHFITESRRGAQIESMLSQLHYMSGHTQLICLSATLPNVPDMANWLNAQCYEAHDRPVELRSYLCLFKATPPTSERLQRVHRIVDDGASASASSTPAATSAAPAPAPPAPEAAPSTVTTAAEAVSSAHSVLELRDEQDTDFIARQKQLLGLCVQRASAILPVALAPACDGRGCIIFVSKRDHTVNLAWRLATAVARICLPVVHEIPEMPGKRLLEQHLSAMRDWANTCNKYDDASVFVGAGLGAAVAAAAVATAAAGPAAAHRPHCLPQQQQQQQQQQPAGPTMAVQLCSELARRQRDLLGLLQKLERSECGLSDTFVKLMLCGVAYHHAHLTSQEKAVIEEGFRSRTLLVLVSTTTLAHGVNLPASRVVVREPTTFNGSFYQPHELQQMCGRAGRYGHDDHGDTFLMAEIPKYRGGRTLDAVTTMLTTRTLPALRSTLEDHDGVGMQRAVLQLVTATHASLAHLRTFAMECTLFASLYGPERARELVDGAIRDLRTADLITVHMSLAQLQAASRRPPQQHRRQPPGVDDSKPGAADLEPRQEEETEQEQEGAGNVRKAGGGGRPSNHDEKQKEEDDDDDEGKQQEDPERVMFNPTQLGLATFHSAQPPTDAGRALAELVKARHHFFAGNSLHAIYLSLPEGSLPCKVKSVSAFAAVYAGLPESVQCVGAAVGVEADPIMQRVAQGKRPMDDGAAGPALHRFLAALILFDHCELCILPQQHQEQQQQQQIREGGLYDLSAGKRQRLVQDTCQRAGILATFCDRLQWRHLAAVLSQVSRKLGRGTPEHLVLLCQLDGMHVSFAEALYDAGVDSPMTLLETPVDDVALCLRDLLPFHIRSSGDDVRMQRDGHARQFAQRLHDSAVQWLRQWQEQQERVRLLNAR